MKYRPLGNTGIEVSEVGMGCNTIAGDGTYGYQDEAAGIATVKRAIELGVTLFDTAESYGGGASEEALGKIIGNRRDVIICSKVSTAGGKLQPEGIRPAAEASLRRLQREVIDVYLLHNPSTDLVIQPGFLEAMQELQRDGLIRACGVSAPTNDQVNQSRFLLDQGSYSAIEIQMNLVQRETLDEVLPRSRDANVGIIVRVPLANGLLTGKYSRDSVFPENDFRNARVSPEDKAKIFDGLDRLKVLAEQDKVPLPQAALAWILAQDGVSTVIPGCRTPEQVEANVAASEISLSQGFLEGARTQFV